MTPDEANKRDPLRIVPNLASEPAKVVAERLAPDDPQAWQENAQRKVGRVELAWDGYRRRVVPEDAGETQIRETRWAFFGGVAACMDLLKEFYSEGDVQGEESLRAMQAELAAFRGGEVEDAIRARETREELEKTEKATHVSGSPPNGAG
jgi:hypothetical protein